MAAEVWRELRAAVGGSFVAKSEIERRLVLPGGGSITVKSADHPDSLRGAGLDGVVLDEAALLRPTVWTHAVRPALSDRRGWAMFLTTPRGQSNWVHDIWLEAAEGGEWARWQMPTRTNPMIDEVEIEAARRNLGSYVFRQEYLAEFVQRGSILPVDELRKATVSQDGLILHKPEGDKGWQMRDCQVFLVVDLAVSLAASADYTAIMAVAATPEADLVVLDLIRERLEAPDQLKRVKMMHARWQADFILVESVQYQLSFLQIARQEGLPVRRLKTDRDKVSRALTAQARMELGAVYVNEQGAWRGDFEDELASFPDGAHDDQVDVLAYAAIEIASGGGDWGLVYDPQNFKPPEKDAPSKADENPWLVTPG